MPVYARWDCPDAFDSNGDRRHALVIYGADSNACCPRLIAACKSTIERNTPRLSRRLVSAAKKVSTALRHEQEVGVKWNTNRGWRENQASTFGCLCVA